jgi:stage II sporulation protein E
MPKILFTTSLLSRQNGLLALIAFFIGRATVLTGFFPCCLSFFTGVLLVDRARIPVVFFWSFLGLLSAGPLGQGLFYGFMMLVLYLITHFVSENRCWTWPPVLAMLVTVVGRGLQLFITELHPVGLLRVGLEGILVFILSMIFIYVMPVILRHNSLRGLGNEETVCLVILGALVMLGFSGLQFGPISLQQVFGRYLIMLLALIGGSGMGAALGTTYGIIGMLSQGLPATTPGIYAFTGLLAGAFRGLGKFGAGLSFLAGDLLLSFYILHTPDLSLFLIHCCLACGLLLITPSRYLNEVAGMVPGTVEYRRIQDEYDRRVRQIVIERLNQVVQVFRELGGTMEEITATEQSRDHERINQLFRGICHQVCEACNLYQSCWEEEFYKTYRLIFDLLGLVESHGEITREQVPPGLRRRCVRLPELIAGINHLFALYSLDQYWQRRLRERGNMVSNQLSGVADIIKDLTTELNVEAGYQEGLAASLQSELMVQGVDIVQLNAFSKPDDQFEINLIKIGCPGNAQCSRVVRPVAEKICGVRLRLEQRQCALRTGRGQCVLRLKPAPTFSVLAGGARQGKNGSSISGDNYSISELGDGRLALILSDGMGVGEQAFQESAITIALLEKLLAAGFNEELSLRTVNSILMLRSEEENFATVDLVVLNLYGGEAVFIKGGSCCSFIKRGRQVSMIQSPSLPIGIVKDIRVQVIRRRLREGDTIVMVTDGVVGDKRQGYHWLVEQLKQSRTDDPQKLAENILEQAKERPDLRADDMAVLAARMERED